jgi:cell division transport system ATP-binding protein
MSILRLRDAYIQQADGAPILQGIDLSLDLGEFVYLVGKTGSGKTSLIRTLYGALPLAGGTGEVAEHQLAGLTAQEIPFLRRKLGIVFQDFQLLTDRNVYENMLFVLQATGWTDKSAMHTRILQVLESVNLVDKSESMPFALSGGEQQRVTIARALLNSPQLILADEPTGNLDPETSDDILALLRKLADDYQVAVLCATHDYRVIQNFPARIIRVQKGKLLDEQGQATR